MPIVSPPAVFDRPCPACGFLNRREASFCGDCAEAMAAARMPPEPAPAPARSGIKWWLAGAVFALAILLQVNNIRTERRLRKDLAAAARAPKNVPPPAAPRVVSGGPAARPAGAGDAGIEWVPIPGGSFMMGSDGAESDEKPVHRVSVKPFQMAKTEVTNKQYRACVSAGACSAPGSYAGGDDHPVVNVDWEQARKFSEWVGGRLPTEAEWEYAARGAGKDYKYPWGNEDATCDRAVMDDGGNGCGRHSTWPVCSKPDGNTEQGLCDMAGNVWEWTRDWHHGSYNGAPNDGSAWESPEGSHRVLRGGSWYNDAGYARSALRHYSGPGLRDVGLGFRPSR